MFGFSDLTDIMMIQNIMKYKWESNMFYLFSFVLEMYFWLNAGHCISPFSLKQYVTFSELLDVVEQAFFPTLETICDAPHTSPLLEINPANVAELLLSLLRGT